MHVYHKWQSYDVWILIECDKQILLSFFTIFWKICLEIFSFYTSLPKIMIMLYCSWDMVHDGCNSYFSFFFLFFALLHPNSLKYENFQKTKKTPRDVIILHKCTKNYNHMVYCSWDIERDGCNCYFSFWAIFCPFYPSNLPKKWKFQ